MTHLPAKDEQVTAILDMLGRMHSDLAMYDYLLPGDYVPDPPLQKRWFRWRPAFGITQEMLVWAGDIARARSLMDLQGAIDAIREITSEGPQQ